MIRHLHGFIRIDTPSQPGPVAIARPGAVNGMERT